MLRDANPQDAHAAYLVRMSASLAIYANTLPPLPPRTDSAAMAAVRKFGES